MKYKMHIRQQNSKWWFATEDVICGVSRWQWKW